MVKLGYKLGFSLGFMFLVVMGLYSLGFWFGAKLVDDQTTNPTTDEPYKVKDIISTFFSVYFSLFAFPQLAPS